jgi:hypothetical protein
MEFLTERCYSAINVAELKVGSKVIVADTLEGLKRKVETGSGETTLSYIEGEHVQHRFVVSENNNTYNMFSLCYLVGEPKKLKWTDLKVGDIIREVTIKSMVVNIDTNQDTNLHVLACIGISPELTWLNDKVLEGWKKVEK